MSTPVEGMNTEAPHGLPIKVFSHDGTSIETILFASARKEPKLRGMIKEIDALERKMTGLQSQAEMIPIEAEAEQAEMSAAKDGKDPKKVLQAVRELRQKGEKLVQEIDDINDKRIDKICEFFEAGLKSAGYSGEPLEMHYQLLAIKNYPEIRLVCMTGCGIADFTKKG
jgi:hypothetical protein